ncbi:hypothetical protein L195_g059997, partial [Trifolium pratense]
GSWTVLKIDHGGAKAGKVDRPQYNGSCRNEVGGHGGS